MQDYKIVSNEQYRMVNIFSTKPLAMIKNNTMTNHIALNKQLLAPIALIGLLTIATFFMSAQSIAADNTAVNLYEKNYKAQNANNIKSLNPNVQTEMFVSNRKEDDNIRMLEEGYDLMGTTGFTAGNVSPELALQFGKTIKADTVLVYSKYGSEKTNDSKMQLIREAAKNKTEVTEADLAATETQYNYFASYWAKLPTPLMGIHVIKLVQTTKEGPKPEAGLQLIAVIVGSPAAKAGLVRGDALLTLGDVKMDKPEDLFAAVKRYAGQTVAAEYERAGEVVKTSVTLNTRK